MRGGLWAYVLLSGWMCAAQAGEAAPGYPWRVTVINQQTGASKSVTTKETTKLAGTGGWSCRVVINPASTDIDHSTNEKITKQTAVLACSHGKSKVEVPATANSNVSALATAILSDGDASASFRLALESAE